MPDIILTLRPASKAVITPDHWSGSRLIIDGIPVWGGFPPWGSCPDVLYEARSRALCGITYGVHERSRARIKDLVDLMDHGTVRYREFRACTKPGDIAKPSAPSAPLNPKAVPWTAQQFLDEDYVEIVWSEESPDMFGLGQLANDTWYYTQAGDPIALRISDLDEIAETYGLVLTPRLALPCLEVRSLDS